METLEKSKPQPWMDEHGEPGAKELDGKKSLQSLDRTP
jgi:hypothetical protein